MPTSGKEVEKSGKWWARSSPGASWLSSLEQFGRQNSRINQMKESVARIGRRQYRRRGTK